MTYPALTVSPGASPARTIAINADWLSVLVGLALPLVDNAVWDGTPAEQENAAELADELIDLLMSDIPAPSTGGSFVIGSIVSHALATLPAEWLPCNGATFNRVDYPDLYTVLDSSLILDADTFKTPNLADKFPLASGTRLLGDTGGAESHALTWQNIPTQYYLLKFVFPGSTGTIDANDSFGYNQQDGLGTPIPTMPPYYVIKYAIVAATS